MRPRWGWIAAGWLVWGLFYASRLRLVIPGSTWGQALAYSLPDALLWAALTPIPIVLARRFPLRVDRLLQTVPLHLAAAIGIAALHSLVDATINVAGATALGRSESFAPVLSHVVRHTLHPNLIIYFCIVGLVQFLARSRRLRERDRQAIELKAQLTQARLDALQTQLRPHFLFNALNTVSGLIEDDTDAARRVLRQLGDVLRMSLEYRDAQEVPLARELEIVRAYLDIESTRFGDRLSVKIDVKDETLGLAVPALILQPLVENAISHGISRRPEGGTVEVAAWKDGARLELEVRDFGSGRPDEGGAPPGLGIGLANTRARLSQLYPDAYRMTTRQSDRGGFDVTLSLPARTLEGRVRRSA